MAFAPEYFTWGRPLGWKYVWKTTQAWPTKFTGDLKLPPKEPFMVPDPSSKDARKMRGYDPLTAHPNLFKVFADLDGSAQSFANFANEYGSLGVARMLAAVHGDSITTTGQSGESLARWEEEHRRIQDAATIVTYLRDGNIDALVPRIRIWETGARWEAARGPIYGWSLICETKHGHRTELWKWATAAKSSTETVRRLAAGFAQGQINDAMSGKPDDDLCTSARLLFDVERKSISMFLMPNTLLAALWLQCANMLAGPGEMRSCEHCGKAFSVSKSGRRSDAKYCSPKCKVAAFRRKMPKGTGRIGG